MHGHETGSKGNAATKALVKPRFMNDRQKIQGGTEGKYSFGKEKTLSGIKKFCMRQVKTVGTCVSNKGLFQIIRGISALYTRGSMTKAQARGSALTKYTQDATESGGRGGRKR